MHLLSPHLVIKQDLQEVSFPGTESGAGRGVRAADGVIKASPRRGVLGPAVEVPSARAQRPGRLLAIAGNRAETEARVGSHILVLRLLGVSVAWLAAEAPGALGCGPCCSQGELLSFYRSNSVLGLPTGITQTGSA